MYRWCGFPSEPGANTRAEGRLMPVAERSIVRTRTPVIVVSDDEALSTAHHEQMIRDRVTGDALGVRQAVPEGPETVDDVVLRTEWRSFPRVELVHTSGLRVQDDQYLAGRSPCD